MSKNTHRSSHKIIASCFSLQAIGIGIYISFGVFFNPLMTEFGWSRAVISGASSFAFFISGLFAIYVGRFNDKFGPKLILVISAIFLGTGCILMSGLNSIWKLYLFFGFIFGIGLSSIDVIALSTIARWFPDSRGFMTGITKVGTGAGQFIFPLMTSSLITAYGWRHAYLVLGIIALISLTVIAKLIKRNPEETSSLNKPKEEDTSHLPEVINLSFSQASKTVQLWIICFIYMIIVSCLMSILIHIVPHSRDIGISAHKAAGVLSAIGGVSMLGRFISGIIIDRIGSKRSMVFSILILILGLSWLQTSDNLWKMYVFACIYGFAHGGFFTVISPIIAEFFGTESHGAIFGMVIFFGTSGGALGPIITGYIFDLSGSYTVSFWLLLTMSILGLICLILLKPISQSKQVSAI